MAAGRAIKGLARPRPRDDEDEENDDGHLLISDSQSEASVVTGADLHENSVADDGGAGKSKDDGSHKSLKSGKKDGKSRKQGTKMNNDSKPADLNSTQTPAFKLTADTEAMMHGLSINDRSQDALSFETSGNDPSTRSKQKGVNANGEQATKQRREHEEYKKKRDADPAFIPNRGNFFMHDTRGQPNGGPAPFRGTTGSRGRGRGGLSEATTPGTTRDGRAAEQVWKHDLHAAINEELANPGVTSQDAFGVARGSKKPEKTPSGPMSFSSTQLLGKIQFRVLLPGMAKAITYSEVPAMKYVRLPDHRPPLRRDKPVRIFLPNIGPRYIFPSTERSFIFIPRQMRPNQRGFASLQQRSIGGYGYSSRSTSMYGGSMYSASVAPSRRSSITRDRENMFSPASYVSGYQPPHRPVVRLPHNGPFYNSSTSPMMPYSGQHTPVGQIHTYPLPQQPAYQGTPTTTVQHPRPQKAISVSGIESPAMLAQQHPSSTDRQAFHGQLPTHMADHSAHPSQGSIGYDLQHHQMAYQAGSAIASPLHRIPENGMHAGNYQPQPMYYPPYNGTQQGYYYPQMQLPMYPVAPMQQQPYPLPGAGPLGQRTMPQSGDGGPANTDMVAHESNGMVFYVPATEAAAQNDAPEYQPAEGFVPTYAAQGLPPAPAPDQSMYYYMGVPGAPGDMNFYPPIQQS